MLITEQPTHDPEHIPLRFTLHTKPSRDKTYRAFYGIEKDIVEFVAVFDVNPHEY